MDVTKSECGVRYISCKDIILINKAVMSYTPKEQCGVANQGYLESAQAGPHRYLYYNQCEDILTLAASLFIAINKSHAFHNGNKRTAFLASIVFLQLNGVIFEPELETVLDVSRAVAINEKDYCDARMLSSWFKAYSRAATEEEIQNIANSRAPIFQKLLDLYEPESFKPE
jgi:death-on-curing protein